MKPFVVRPLSRLKGEILLSGDKSIAHRAIIISAISRGITRIENFPFNEDCLSTIRALQRLGVKIRHGSLKKRKNFPSITVNGGGLLGLKQPKGPVFTGNSGTTLRLLLGVLAGQNFSTKLVAGKSLSKRPMLRVTAPLRLMGAEINAKPKTQHAKHIEEYPPITIKGGNLRAITYKMPVASAQVKSAILLAVLYAQGKTKVIETISTRDHTERMLKLFRARLKVQQNTIVINGNQDLVSPKRVYIPQDISSASFFMVMAAILSDSRILIKKVSLNPSRIGSIKVLKRMGAKIKGSSGRQACLSGRQARLKTQGYEPMGNLLVESSFLKGTRVKKEEIPSLVDELPILMVAACFAKGRTIFEGVGELRVKETDRIRSMTENLRKMGAKIEVFKVGKSEGIIIHGVKQLKAAKVSSFQDHRTAMSMVVAGLAATSNTQIDDISCINKSFPAFLRVLNTLRR